MNAATAENTGNTTAKSHPFTPSPLHPFTRSPLHLIIILSALCLSAAPPTAPDDFIRQGNQAIEAGDYGNALLLYQQAEERGTDPGLIAFNKATAYYHLEDYRKAENHYRMALDDRAIAGERRAKALYNLGDCLVKQAGTEDIQTLRDAIRCYELCLEAGPEAGLHKDAAHNLELAKLLWNRARAKTSNPPSPNTDDPPDEKRPPEPKKKEPVKKDGDSGADSNEKDAKKADIDPKAKIDPKGKADPKEEMKKSNGLPADVPNRLPVLPDTDEPQKRSIEDTRRYLQAAEERLRKERQRMRMDAAIPEKPNGRDW